MKTIAVITAGQASLLDFKVTSKLYFQNDLSMNFDKIAAKRWVKARYSLDYDSQVGWCNLSC